MTQDKQKARNEAIIKSLCIDAVSTLENWESWATNARDTGRITPVQFFAVILHYTELLHKKELDEIQIKRVISQWWERLKHATIKRCATFNGRPASRRLYPVDSITLLEFGESQISNLQGWCLRAKEVDEWLVKAQFVDPAFEFFFNAAVPPKESQSDVVPLSVVPQEDKPPTTWAELKRYHAANPGHAWSQSMRGIVANEESRRRNDGQSRVRSRMAKDLDMTVQAIGEHIRAFNANGPKSGRSRSNAF